MNRIIRASARASLLAAALTFAAALPAFATIVTATGTYSNDADPNNLATGFPSGPFSLTSGATTYSFVDFFPNQTFSLNNITGLSANFTDIAGGADGGAPRFVVGLANGNFYSVYLGPPSSFNQSSPSAFTTAFSGLNLVNATNDTGFKNTGTYQTFASFQAGADGSQIVTDVGFVLDGGWAANGPQALTLNSLSVQFLAAPEPATWTMMAAALGLLGFLVARRRRSSAGAIAA
ncbi:MAG TPA: PEP-CTERM sorting domain-containing protein [Stellaceae bacterium]|nr:PEP-CTERM sorting domain-containing protein [Stellaceae bacterium]